MYAVEFSADAEIDANETSQYFDTKAENLGLKFLEDLYTSAVSIQNNPASFHYYNKQLKIRRCNLRTFNYAIYYTIESNNRLVLLAVINQNRSDTYVKRRLK